LARHARSRHARSFDFRRRVLPLIVPLLVLLIGMGWVVYSRYTAPGAPAPDEAALQQFRNICVKQARHANGGGDLVMDDATEAKIGAYCGCVADGIAARLRPEEIANLATGTQSEETTQILSATISDCQARNLQ
jgi:hypothetical protein